MMKEHAIYKPIQVFSNYRKGKKDAINQAMTEGKAEGIAEGKAHRIE